MTTAVRVEVGDLVEVLGHQGRVPEEPLVEAGRVVVTVVCQRHGVRHAFDLSPLTPVLVLARMPRDLVGAA